MNELKEKYYIALGNLQNMAIGNTKGSKGADICVLDINEYVAYLQSKIDKANEYVNNKDNWKIDLNNILITKEENIYINKNELSDILKEDK